jgi:putative transposase
MIDTGWRSRGYLPHRDEAHLVQHIVFNLADALPDVPADASEPAKRLAWADNELDKGHGAQLLHGENALLVENCILHDHGRRYALAAWCIMPNHVHVMIEQFPGHRLSSAVQTWKSVTAHAINKREGLRGALWQREYFDRHMRDEEQFARTVAYIERNPVAAGLVERPEDWRFSSAWAARDKDAGAGAGAPVDA